MSSLEIYPLAIIAFADVVCLSASPNYPFQGQRWGPVSQETVFFQRWQNAINSVAMANIIFGSSVEVLYHAIDWCDTDFYLTIKWLSNCSLGVVVSGEPFYCGSLTVIVRRERVVLGLARIILCAPSLEC